MNHSRMKLNVIIIVGVKSAGIYVMKQYIYIYIYIYIYMCVCVRVYIYIYSKVIFKIKGTDYNLFKELNLKNRDGHRERKKNP